MKSLVEFINESLINEGKFSELKVKKSQASDSFKKAQIKRMRDEYPELDPDGFKWVNVGDTCVLKHNGRKSTKKKKVTKPEGMSDWDYLKMIAKDNKKFGDEFEKVGGEDEDEWKPLKIANPHDLHDVEDYEASFYINKEGIVIIANPNDGARCSIHKPYAKKDNRGVKRYFAIDIYKDGEHVNQGVKALIERAWGKEVADDFAEYEKQQLKRA